MCTRVFHSFISTVSTVLVRKAIFLILMLDMFISYIYIYLKTADENSTYQATIDIVVM